MKRFIYLTILVSLFSLLSYAQNTTCNGGRVFIDGDNDGFFGMVSVCINTVLPGTPTSITIGNDCDDLDELLNPNTRRYIDNDGDGFGNPNVFITQCMYLQGYVLDNSDCDDNNANVNPNTIWYVDADNDGFGNSISPSILQCIKPNGFYATNNTDCNDSNPFFNKVQNWYPDIDGDGFGSGTAISSCVIPAIGYVNNNLDQLPTISGPIQGSIVPSQSEVYGASQNYIITTTPKIAVSSTQAISDSKNVAINISYFDGLGRPIQQLANQQSGSGKNIVTHIEYDAFGRQVKDFLPYSTTGTGLDFVSSAATDVGTFYNRPMYQNTINPYSEKLLETSPLNRVLEQAAPGADWGLAAPTKHTIRLDYQTNGANEVKLFAATTSWSTSSSLYEPALTQITNYTQNELYKVVTKNENWKTTDLKNTTTEEFKDKEGKVVLKRTYNGVEIFDTYYVYDMYGNLTYVLPPLVDTTITVTPAILDGLCYQYKYDYRNRLAAKKISGKQWEFIVYDKLDRVVATGPAFAPFSDKAGAQGWMITKYDAFSRPIITGWKEAICTDSARALLQTAQNSATTLNETKTAAAALLDAVNVQYTNTVVPTDFKLLTVNYFDDYNYPDAPATFTDVEGQPVFYNSTTKPRGLPTGAWIRVAQTTTAYVYEKSYPLYDYKARPISSKTTNFLGGYTQTDIKLDFMGKTLYTITKHKRDSNTAELLIKDEFTYTDQDRLLTQTHQINSLPKQLIVSNTYDELGKLTSKKVGGTDTTGSTGMQKVDYAYNIRGWLTDINNVDNLNQIGDPQDLFAFKINYNTPATATALFNGNISETLWRTKSDYTLRKYSYSYDHLNRLLSANYAMPQSGTINKSYDESLNYDKNGNIINLTRNGGLETYGQYPAILIDNLIYTYSTQKPNQLMKVYDQSNNSSGFKDDAQGVPDLVDDYDYDNNGNLTKDDNKKITQIIYNHLNLPTKIIFGTTGNIVYIYNAIGQKVAKVVDIPSRNGVPCIIYYLNGFQYIFNENYSGYQTKLQFFPTAEGYVEPSGSSYKYVYQYKDHLGNVRYTYDRISYGIQEENNYYPFGMKHEGYNNYSYMPVVSKYKFQGQERQDELGLNWDSFKWRNYDFAIGRFMSIDPLAEDYTYNSTYAFSENRVIDAREIEGLEAQLIKDYYSGMGEGMKSVFKATANAIAHPIDTAKAIMSSQPQSSLSSALGMTSLNPMSVVVDMIVPAMQGDAKGVGKVGGEALAGAIVDGAGVAIGAVAGKGLSALTKASGGAIETVAKGATAELTSPNFVVTAGGDAIAIPKGAVGPTAPMKGSGMVYQGGSGGTGMSPKTTGVRIMDANTNQGARVNYMNNATPTAQTVNPTTGRVISNSDPAGHMPINN